MNPVNKSLIPIHLSSIFEPLKIEAYLEGNDDESHFYESFSDLIKAQFDLGLPFVLALVKDIGSSALYCFEAEKLKEWAVKQGTNPLTNSKIERIFQFSISSNKNYHFNYSGEWDLKEGKLILGKNLKVSGKKSFMRIEGDYKIFSLRPLITYLFVDVNDCVYIPSTQKKITFSNIIALQKKKNIPYIFAAVKDKNALQNKISYFETSNFQTSKINPVTNQEIDKLIYCMLSFDQTQKPIINYLGAQKEMGDKKCFLDTCFKATSGDVEAQYILGTYYKEGKGVAKNFSEAYRWFKIAAEAEYTEAQFELGMCYNEGKGIKKDCKKAITYLTIASKKNYIEALYQLSLNYLNGQGVVKDVHTAMNLLSLAKEERHELAKIKFDEWYETSQQKLEGYIHHNLGTDYFTGEFIGKDVNKALKYWTLAANVGLAASAYEIGNCLNEIDKCEDAITWLKIGADLGSKEAELSLGMSYSEGRGVAINYEKAFYYVNLSASEDSAVAQYALGIFYLKGVGVVQNEETAIYYLELSANQGYRQAQFNLGFLYGSKKDYKLSIKWLTLAEKQGCAEAQASLGVYYLQGLGLKQNSKMAFKYFLLSANQGNASGQFKIGFCYQEGEGVTQNNELSLKYFMLSADQNYGGAQHVMGMKYLSGKGVAQDYTLAVKYFTLSSEQGTPDSMYQLALCWNHGLGVPKDEELGCKYWRLAAEKGYDEAQFTLGIHCFGKGSQQDIAEGMQFIKLAADQGHKGALNFTKISK